MPRHARQTDTKLAEGTISEVSASGIKAFMDSKAQHSGLASLDSMGIVPSTQLPPPPAVPVTSVNHQTGDVELDAADVGAIDVGLLGAPMGVAQLDSSSKVPKTEIETLAASDIQNDSWVTGASVKDALNQLNSGIPMPIVSLIPDQGFLFPISTTRAYWEKILYSSTAIFNDGTNLRNYVAYYGNGTWNFVCYSNDGANWDTETQLTGVTQGYHCEVILIGTTIHLFYWDTTHTIYSPAAVRHATFNIAANCSVAVTDLPLSGNYITGIFADGLRYGTYGVDRAFYNVSPTNNPLNPYSYAWCIIHDGTDGTNEGELFATSSDGYNFSSWNGSTEVIARGTKVPLQWDAWLGNAYVWKEGSAWYMYYAGGVGTGNGADSNFADGIGFATSTDGITWVKYANNPIFFKTFSYKSAKRLYCPCVVKQDDGWILYYTAKSQAGTYRVSTAIINRLI